MKFEIILYKLPMPTWKLCAIDLVIIILESTESVMSS